jgi:hypothetical protein
MYLNNLSDTGLEKARRRFAQVCCMVSRELARTPGPDWELVVETLTQARRELADEVTRRRSRSPGEPA